ncbi:hypothetical protein PBOI14_31400 [Pseudomonas sp. Boi14]|nr:hypothetical protein PBOI14_31400 [Pseudomonas sp. Boi14]
MAGKAPGHMQQRPEGTGHAEKGPQVGPGHDRHAQERGFPQGLAQPFEQWADGPGVIRRGDHLMALDPGPGHLAVDIRDAIAVDELQGRVLFEEGHHLRPVIQKGVDACGIVALPQLMLEVGARLLRVFMDAGAACQGIARHPHPAAGPGAGTAKSGILFHNYHLQAMPRGGHRTGQAGGAGADHQQVTIQGREGCSGNVAHNDRPFLISEIKWNYVPFLWKTIPHCSGRCQTVPEFQATVLRTASSAATPEPDGRHGPGRSASNRRLRDPGAVARRRPRAWP